MIWLVIKTVVRTNQNILKQSHDYKDFSASWLVFVLIFFHLLARKPNLEKKILFFQSLPKSSFTCPRLRASGLVQRLVDTWAISVISRELPTMMYRGIVDYQTLVIKNHIILSIKNGIEKYFIYINLYCI